MVITWNDDLPSGLTLTLCKSNLRYHPQIRVMDMVHAQDYANMSFNQLKTQLETSKKKDLCIAKKMQ